MDTSRPLRLQRIEEKSAWSWRRGLLALGAFAPAILRMGWAADDQLIAPALVHGIQAVLLLIYAIVMLRTRIAMGEWPAFVKKHGFEASLVGVAIVFLWWWPVLALLTGLLIVHQLLQLYLLAVDKSKMPPGLIFIGSFIVLIAIGSAALMLPAATPPDQPIGVVDSVFTITSAISQTGLVVRPTGEGFTRFGHVIIMVWIQLGALGILVFGAVFALMLGASFGLKATRALGDSTEQGWSGQITVARLVVFIIVVTHVFEAIGAATLYFGWPETWEGAPGMETRADRLFHSVFFAVSGFCNAGFVTTDNSLNGLRTHWTSLIVIAGLIFMGSLGFPVLANILRVVRGKIRGMHVMDGTLVRLDLNAKLILSMTLLVYVLGYLMLLTGELSQAEQPFRLAIADAHFMTISRTAGFETIPPSEMGAFSQLVLILLMFIGGSPVSVAGGIKMMVFAVLLMTVWAAIRGRTETTAFGRTIPDELVRKSAAIIVLCLVSAMATAGFLAAVEGGRDGMPLADLIFEAVSAFGTVGYSMGITADLSPASRIALTIAMFIGRVGVLAVLATVVEVARKHQPRYSYASEGVLVY
ncbi:MAG: hypothetical protein EA376_06530 [Phycisphaeraceae bacterium]|nr:MAG: hypothetical protein EA376_06530 [Phycisphaeraceae bacterium]